MIVLTTEHRADLLGHPLGSPHKEDRLLPLQSVIENISTRIHRTIKWETTDEGVDEMSNSLMFKISNHKNEKITVETEYLAVAATCYCYLKSHGINCSIEVRIEPDFVQGIDELAEITSYLMPNAMINKKLYDIEDNEFNLNHTIFQFKFTNSFFQNGLLTSEMFVDALKECSFLYGNRNSEKSISATITKRDMKNIKFTALGFKKLSKMIRNHKKLFNTPYENVEEALEYWGLIE
jgi:hypothetical protein